MSRVKTKPIELGVCRLVTNTRGSWEFKVVLIPASTKEDQILKAAIKAYLDKYEGVFISHAWVQCVMDEVEYIEYEEFADIVFKEVK